MYQVKRTPFNNVVVKCRGEDKCSIILELGLRLLVSLCCELHKHLKNVFSSFRWKRRVEWAGEAGGTLESDVNPREIEPLSWALFPHHSPLQHSQKHLSETSGSKALSER